MKEVATSTLMETVLAFVGFIACSGLTAVYLLLEINQAYAEISTLTF